MSRYEAQLLACGFSPEMARIDAWANDIARLANQERYQAEAEQARAYAKTTEEAQQ